MTQPLPAAGSSPAAPVLPVSPVAGVAPTAPAQGAAPVAPTQAAAPVAPATPALNLSAQAQQALRLQVFQALIAQLVTQVQSGSPAMAPQWPAAGVAPPLREMLAALIAQATAGLPQPQQLVAVQPWPQAWVNAVLPPAAATAPAGSAAPPATPGAQAVAESAPGAAAGPGARAAASPGGPGAAPQLPPLQTLLVQQGVVRAADGERAFALTLQVPQAWAQSQAVALPVAGAALPAVAPAPAPAPVPLPLPLQLPFAAPAQQLESGALALVLQGAAPGGERMRTSALLWLDFQPLPAAQSHALAGLLPSAQMAQQALATLQARNDPWLQMAALQASGQQPRGEQRIEERRTGLCTEPGCPYRSKASCAQPFCADMNRVWAAARVGGA